MKVLDKAGRSGGGRLSATTAARFDRAFSFARQGRTAQAEKLCRQILRKAPRHFGALSLMGFMAFHQRRFDDAERLIGRALAIDPDNVEALSNRGAALKELGRLDEALACYDRALAIAPSDPAALNNRSIVLDRTGRLEEALAGYDAALTIDPDYVEAWSNRGEALQQLRRFDDAIASYRRALALRPGFAEARLAESLCRLLIGDFKDAWRNYEARRALRAWNEPRRFNRSQWVGDEPLAGKTVLLHAEQGLGDTIQFCRYASMVAARGARVILEVQKPLKRLLGSLAGVDAIVARGEPLPAFDLHCPLPSLPLAFATSLDSIPAGVPYLSASPAKIAQWSARLGVARRPRIGLVWSGNPDHANDRNRSIRLADMAAVLQEEADFFSLQKELRPDDADTLARYPALRHFGDELADFADTAAIAALMDVVISVDTSVAHLAAALGRPTWILLPWVPDWRWMLERDDSPWYPTARLFRQPERGDWSAALQAVKLALRQHGRMTEQAPAEPM